MQQSNLTPFSIEQYEKLVRDAQTHQVVTRDGRSVRVLATDRKGPAPIVTLVLNQGGEDLRCYIKGGRWVTDSVDSGHDLFIRPIPPKSLGWVLISHNKERIWATFYPERPIETYVNTLACKEIFEGDGLTPEAV